MRVLADLACSVEFKGLYNSGLEQGLGMARGKHWNLLVLVPVALLLEGEATSPPPSHCRWRRNLKGTEQGGEDKEGKEPPQPQGPMWPLFNRARSSS